MNIHFNVILCVYICIYTYKRICDATHFASSVNADFKPTCMHVILSFANQRSHSGRCTEHVRLSRAIRWTCTPLKHSSVGMVQIVSLSSVSKFTH